MTAAHHPLARKITALLVVMLVLFPKGGFRAGDFPVTWGYGLLGLLSLMLLPYRLLALRVVYLRTQLVALACILPFLSVIAYSALMFGIQGDRTGFVVQCVDFVFLPWVFLWLFPPFLEFVDGQQVIRLLRWCVLAAALFGLFNFFWRPVAGFFVSIPLLTSNYGDLDPSFTKNIARGFFFKLISTYNNGNIYGAATLILINLYDLHTPQRWRRWIVRVALALTLSRTVWAGLIFDLLLSLGSTSLREVRRFPWLDLRKVRTPLFLILFTVIAIIGVTAATGLTDRGGTFLLDPTLGGRAGTVTRLSSVPLIPDGVGLFSIAEIVYASAAIDFGYIGAPTIALALCSPLIVLLGDMSALDNPTRRAALRGLILYSLVCFSDGAIDLIPTMAFFWFTYMVYLFGLPSLGRVTPVEAANQEPKAMLVPNPSAA